MPRRNKKDPGTDKHRKDRRDGSSSVPAKPRRNRDANRDPARSRDRLAEQLRAMFFGPERRAELIVVLALRPEPDDNWTVERQMMDWGGMLVGDRNELSDGAKRAIVESIMLAPVEKEKTVVEVISEVGSTVESGVDFAHRNAPKIKSILDFFRGKAPTEKDPHG